MHGPSGAGGEKKVPGQMYVLKLETIICVLLVSRNLCVVINTIRFSSFSPLFF